MPFDVTLASQVPDDIEVLGVPVFAGRRLVDGGAAELDLTYLAERGFEGKVGDACPVPADDGTTIVALGVGEPGDVTAETLRRAAAAFVKAAWHDRTAALTLLDAAGVLDRGVAAQAVTEGSLLAAYRFTRYKGDPKPSQLESLAVVGRGARVQSGLDRGARIAAAVTMARDLVNSPAGDMTPTRLAEVATEIGEREGLEAYVLDEAASANE